MRGIKYANGFHHSRKDVANKLGAKDQKRFLNCLRMKKKQKNCASNY